MEGKYIKSPSSLDIRDEGQLSCVKPAINSFFQKIAFFSFILYYISK
ncbi:hypothetical protein SD78_0255 [Bacillus badius]|nr:hypothetical protein SD78_0255 [Bacillus badius]